MQVPLVDFTLDNGATQLLPGSHRRACRVCVRPCFHACLQCLPPWLLSGFDLVGMQLVYVKDCGEDRCYYLLKTRVWWNVARLDMVVWGAARGQEHAIPGVCACEVIAVCDCKVSHNLLYRWMDHTGGMGHANSQR